MLVRIHNTIMSLGSGDILCNFGFVLASAFATQCLSRGVCFFLYQEEEEEGIVIQMVRKHSFTNEDQPVLISNNNYFAPSVVK